MITRPQIAYPFVTFLPEQGVDIRYVQSFPSYELTKTTEIYTCVSKKSFANIKSPLDRILDDNKQNNNDLQ